MMKNNTKKSIKWFVIHGAIVLLTLTILTTPLAMVTYAGTDDSNVKETAIEWVNNYTAANNDPDCNDMFNSNLSNTDDDARGWYDTLSLHGGFTKVFEWGDSNAFETDWEKSSVGGFDSSWADNVDLIYFSGHGGIIGGKAEFAFGADQDGDASYHCRVVNSEAQWGDKDVEWITLSASRVLDINYQSQWTLTFKDLHGITGFDDSPTDSPNTGGLFACYLTGGTFLSTNCAFDHVVGDSWKQATIDDQTNVEAAVLRGIVTISGSDKDYWTDFADSMWPDPPNGQYKQFMYTKWNT